MDHGLRLAVLAQEIGVTVVGDIVGGGRRVDEEDVAGIGEIEDALHVLRMQLAYLVHHAVDAEVAEASAHLLLEHVDEHDVYHRLYQGVRSLAAHV